MAIHDPLGLLSPFTLKPKLLLRETWELKLGWDETLPQQLHDKWCSFFVEMFEAEQQQWPRCLKPDGEVVSGPVLVLMSDGSDYAYGTMAFIRWQLADGSVWVRLIMSKSRISPSRKFQQ